MNKHPDSSDAEVFREKNAIEPIEKPIDPDLEAFKKQFEEMKKAWPLLPEGRDYFAMWAGPEKAEAMRKELVEERDELRAKLAESEAQCAAMRDFISERDPASATALYERIADAFQKETGRWAPGRSVPPAVGSVDRESAEELWRPFVNKWHEKRFAEVLSGDAGRALLAELKELREADVLISEFKRTKAERDEMRALAEKMRAALMVANADLNNLCMDWGQDSIEDPCGFADREKTGFARIGTASIKPCVDALGVVRAALTEADKLLGPVTK
jgi:hypothetical protein